MYFKSKKELNYDIFVDPIILGAARLVHSDLRIYRISFFLLDLIIRQAVACGVVGRLDRYKSLLRSLISMLYYYFKSILTIWTWRFTIETDSPCGWIFTFMYFKLPAFQFFNIKLWHRKTRSLGTVWIINLSAVITYSMLLNYKNITPPNNFRMFNQELQHIPYSFRYYLWLPHAHYQIKFTGPIRKIIILLNITRQN